MITQTLLRRKDASRMHLTGYSGLGRFRRQVMRGVMQPGEDAQHYQVKAVRLAIEESRK